MNILNLALTRQKNKILMPQKQRELLHTLAWSFRQAIVAHSDYHLNLILEVDKSRYRNFRFWHETAELTKQKVCCERGADLSDTDASDSGKLLKNECKGHSCLLRSHPFASMTI